MLANCFQRIENSKTEQCDFITRIQRVVKKKHNGECYFEWKATRYGKKLVLSFKPAKCLRLNIKTKTDIIVSG